MSDNVFGEADQQAPNQEVDNPFADKLSGIVNQDGKPKYDTVDKALEALKHSQQFIPQLQQENEQYKQQLEELKVELEKRSSVEDVVQRLLNKQETPVDEPTPNPASSGLDENTVKGLFDQLLKQRESSLTLDSNRQKVNEALVGLYGDKTPEVVKAKAEELGTTPSQLGELAAQNPRLVLALFQSQKTTGPKPTTNSYGIRGKLEPDTTLPKPDRSVLSGATAKQQAEYWGKVREHVYRQHNITN